MVLYIAFKMLVGDKGKFLGIILGIGFASLIMTQQPGVFVGLMTRSFSFVTDVNLPDIWVMDPKVKFIDDTKPMPATVLSRVGSVEGVLWAKPLFKSLIQARLPDGNFQSCNVIGIDDTTYIGGPNVMVQGKITDLKRSDSIIVSLEGSKDKLAKKPLKKGDPKIPLTIGDTLEINDVRSVVVGIADVTRTFQSQPTIFMPYSRALKTAPPQRSQLNYVLVKSTDSAKIQELANRIKKQTGYAAYTADQFKDLTINYMMKYTGIPINFGISVLLGFLVGAAIAGQTFYNFTLENLRYFGVLKAMGTKNITLLKMILFQALIVGIIGYGLGIGLTTIFSQATKDTAIAFRFPWQLLVFSFVGVCIISALAALISIIKVIRLEPAIVFKG